MTRRWKRRKVIKTFFNRHAKFMLQLNFIKMYIGKKNYQHNVRVS
jgi:hypothetical protein